MLLLPLPPYRDYRCVTIPGGHLYPVCVHVFIHGCGTQWLMPSVFFRYFLSILFFKAQSLMELTSKPREVSPSQRWNYRHVMQLLPVCLRIRSSTMLAQQTLY